MRVLVTGASGLLGRAVFAHCQMRFGSDAIGTALTRTGPGLISVDLTDDAAVERLFSEHRPEAVIHCAAERRPDVASRDEAAALRLNAHATKTIARCCQRYDAFLVYISTDYVFDGTSPPYATTDKPNPLNFYGKSKLAGERAILDTIERAVVLRVPILYGNVEFPSESSVNVLLDIVKNAETPVNMDHECIRYPTNVMDVARMCGDILDKQRTAQLPSILHFSASEAMTKYDICVMLADLLKISHLHITPITETVASAATASRPKDSALSVAALEQNGLSAEHVPFRTWWQQYLGV